MRLHVLRRMGCSSATFTDFGVRKDCRSGSVDLCPDVGWSLGAADDSHRQRVHFFEISSVATPAVPPDQDAWVRTPREELLQKCQLVC